MKLFKVVNTQKLQNLDKLNETEISFSGTIIAVREGQTKKEFRLLFSKLKITWAITKFRCLAKITLSTANLCTSGYWFTSRQECNRKSGIRLNLN